MKTRVTHALVVLIEDTDEPEIDHVQRAIDMVANEPAAHIKNDGSNLTITAERVSK